LLSFERLDRGGYNENKPDPDKKKVKIKTIIIESDDAPNSHVFNIV